MATFAGQGGGLVDSFLNLVTGAGGGGANPFNNPLQPGGQTQNPTTNAILSQLGFQPSNPTAEGQTALAGVPSFGVTPGSGIPQVSTKSSGGVNAPFGSSSADSPPMWLAKNALAAYQSGNTAYMNHLLADPTIANDPHLKNFIVGLFAGDPNRIQEAKYYSTNPSYNGWNNAAGDGIPGDGM